MINLGFAKEQEVKNQIRKALEMGYYPSDIAEKSIEINFELWKENKEGIYNILSSSSHWDEENLCIKLPVKSFRRMDIDKVGYLFSRATEHVHSTIREEMYKRSYNYDYNIGEAVLLGIFIKATNGIFDLIRRENTNIIQDDWIKRYANAYENERFKQKYEALRRKEITDADFGNYIDNNYYINTDVSIFIMFKYFRVSAGTKFSRLLRKIMERLNILDSKYFNGTYTIDGEERYTNYFVEMSDLLNPIEIEMTTYISIHPVDYLTMAHGYNWTSCHRVANNWYNEGGQGCYHSGVLSMMCSKSTLIMYELPDKPEPWKEGYEAQQFLPKLTRSSIFISTEGNAIFQNVVYPDSVTDKTTEWRNVLQEILSNYKGLDNRWKTWKKNQDDYPYSKVDVNDDYFNGYSDWDEGKWYSLSVLYREDGELFNRLSYIKFEVGCEYTVTIDNPDELLYETDEYSTLLSDNDRRHCAHCEERYSEDDLTYVRGVGYICSSCYDDLDCYYCEDCWDHYSDSDRTRIRVRRNGRLLTMCSYCVENRSSLVECEDCGDYTDDTIQYLDRDGNYVCYCEDCASNKDFGECEVCGATAELDEHNCCYDCEPEEVEEDDENE